MQELIKNEEQVMTAPMMVMDESEKMIADLTQERKTAFCSMVPKNQDEQIILYNAMNNPEKRIKDMINLTIEVKHIFCEIVQCTNRDTGEISEQPRTVLIDTDGVGYQCVSVGIFSALKKIFSIMGSPMEWKKPLKLKVVQISKNDRALLTLEMVK